MRFSDLHHRVAIASAGLLVAVSTACGGTVVFDENGAGGSGASRGDGGSSTDVSGATTSSSFVSSVAASGQGNGGADVTSTAIAQSSAVFASASSGLPDPCLGLACGEECVVCNEFECLGGFCDELGACVPEQVCPTPTEILCYLLAPDETCASAFDAPFFLCRDCGAGKGCTFFGEIFAGPFVSPGECCYEVAGECSPNP